MLFDISISVCIFSSKRTYEHFIQNKKMAYVLQGDISHQGTVSRFPASAGKQCVPNSIYNKLYFHLLFIQIHGHHMK